MRLLQFTMSIFCIVVAAECLIRGDNRQITLVDKLPKNTNRSQDIRPKEEINKPRISFSIKTLPRDHFFQVPAYLRKAKSNGEDIIGTENPLNQRAVKNHMDVLSPYTEGGSNNIDIRRRRKTKDTKPANMRAPIHASTPKAPEHEQQVYRLKV